MQPDKQLAEKDGLTDVHFPLTLQPPVLQTRDDATQNFPASQEGGAKGKPKIHQEDVAQPSQLALEVLPHPDQMVKRLSELEQENICLKWALGLILFPLGLLALLG